MKALENRTIDNKVEMDVLDALDEIKAINQRHERIDTNQLLASLNGKNKSQNATNDCTSSSLNAAEEELLNQFKAKKYGSLNSQSEGIGSDVNISSNSIEVKKNTQQMLAEQLKKQKVDNTNNVPTVIIKKKRKIEAINTPATDTKTPILTTASRNLLWHNLINAAYFENSSNKFGI